MPIVRWNVRVKEAVGNEVVEGALAGAVAAVGSHWLRFRRWGHSYTHNRENGAMRLALRTTGVNIGTDARLLQ